MKNLINTCMRCKPQTISVTQDLSDLKNISDNTAKAIIENCNVHIEIPVKSVRSGMGVNNVTPDKGVEVLYDPHKEDWNCVK